MQNHTVLRARSKKIAALAATGLVAATFTTMTTGTANAESGALGYTCAVPILGEQTFTVVTDTNAPATVPAGKVIGPVTRATVTIPEAVVSPLRDLLGARTGSGTAVVDAVVNGSTQKIKMTVGQTKVPDSGSMAVTATGKGKAIRAGKAGSRITMAASDFTSNLILKKEDGSEAMAAEIPCVLDTGQDAAVDMIKVVKANSRIKLTSGYAKKRKALSARAVVKTSTTLKAAGKVRFIVKRNGKVWRNKAVTLNKAGVAKVNFPKARKGRYVVTAKYAGNKNLKPSQKIAKRRVK